MGAQGWQHLGLPLGQQRRLFAEVSSLAAQNSLVFGDLPRLPRRAAEELLAEAGLLGSVISMTEACDRLGLAPADVSAPPRAGEQAWLFTAQQRRLSSAEGEILAGHTQAAEDTDEDFFDNVS